MTESQLQSAILSALQRLGIWAIRINSGVAERGGRRIRLAEPGTPDILVLKPYGFLEVKTPRGSLSNTQVAWHARARSAGIRVETVRSMDEAIETVRSWNEHRD